jgi:hypothetical protein
MIWVPALLVLLHVLGASVLFIVVACLYREKVHIQDEQPATS